MFRSHPKPNRGLFVVPISSQILLSAFLLMAASPVFAAGLPDTGIDTCRDNPTNHFMVPCAATNAGDAAPYPRQDGRFGWDAAAIATVWTKVGAGAHGFDYTKIANDGSVLASSALLGIAPTDWACTRDNITGLIWEVKRADGLLRDQNHTYTWFNSDGTNNGGSTGTSSGGTCLTAGRCDTEKFVVDVNTPPGLCGATDWRVPTLRELQTLLNLSSSPLIEPTYFPNTTSLSFWTGAPYASTPGSAWYVDFGGGAAYVTV